MAPGIEYLFSSTPPKYAYKKKDETKPSRDKAIPFPSYFNGFERWPFNTKEDRNRYPREA
jgi:hypothetical protein